jgi:transcriptional regulator with XRE-family HTH domain
MDPIRFGLSIRALRRRRRWTQQRLASEAGVSRAVVYRLERGRADCVAVHTLVRVVAALGATVSVRVLWHGEGLDRLLDADHAAIVEATLRLLAANGWDVATETTFNVYGERGSIDVLASHVQSGALLVIEVKSVVPDVQATLMGIDRKARLAPDIARARGWAVRAASRLLVMPNDRTARRRIERHSATFRVALPAANVEIRRWLRAPTGALAGILFVSDAPGESARHRVARRSTDG